MSTMEIPPRHQKAVDYLRKGFVKQTIGRYNHYTVRNEVGHRYFVRILPKECTCPDYKLRLKGKQACKHILAALAFQYRQK